MCGHTDSPYLNMDASHKTPQWTICEVAYQNSKYKSIITGLHPLIKENTPMKDRMNIMSVDPIAQNNKSPEFFQALVKSHLTYGVVKLILVLQGP